MGAGLVLWDVDNTMIANGGVSKETYAGAFELLTGRPAEFRPRTGGSTDLLIMRDLAERHGAVLTEGPENIFGVLEKSLLVRRADLAARGRALPGVRAALDALARMDGAVQSVLTGNIRPNAFVKLDTFGLAGHPLDWDIGAFGSDDHVRANLVGIAQRRAAEKYGVPFVRDNTVLIGDTPNDVRAGLEGGAKVVAVARGSDRAEVLADAGADTVLPGLEDTGSFLAAIKQVLAS
ncbi:haloacid dehalogenase-like hydrolase [Nocardia cyriacigeorgica]|uniref:HAD family hydrolase n=1 Tax=Nocardia cyriacigeorgica TaxID=135487 RepID=UPI001894BA35|nr:HAD hydrolase-like protein [Nocardia cyriacigeorgica]MBF6080557.1 haloacid dehalogenase-like hydrolase [Nocardia cyriacigeorgica]